MLENLRLASQSAWRGRERGLAVVMGIFGFFSYHDSIVLRDRIVTNFL